jgi:hypothetical protein
VLDADGDLYFCSAVFACGDFWGQFKIEKINNKN